MVCSIIPQCSTVRKINSVWCLLKQRSQDGTWNLHSWETKIPPSPPWTLQNMLNTFTRSLDHKFNKISKVTSSAWLQMWMAAVRLIPKTNRVVWTPSRVTGLTTTIMSKPPVFLLYSGPPICPFRLSGQKPLKSQPVLQVWRSLRMLSIYCMGFKYTVWRPTAADETAVYVNVSLCSGGFFWNMMCCWNMSGIYLWNEVTEYTIMNLNKTFIA